MRNKSLSESKSDGQLLPGVLLTSLVAEIGEDLPTIDLDNINDLAIQLEEFISNALPESLVNSSVLYWLTQGLHCSVSTMNEKAALRIGQVIYLLAAKNPDGLIEMLGRTIEFGAFKGQNTAYVWMRELYLATFLEQNNTAIIAINAAMSYLLERARKPLAMSLVANCIDGKEKGKNALYVLAQALKQAAVRLDNQPQTLMLAQLLERSMAQLPDDSCSVIIEELHGGPLLKGKHTLYMLATVLKDVVKDNPPAVNIICTLLSRMIQTQDPALLTSALFKVAHSGEFQGFSSLHIILTSLVSAAYISKNNEVIDKLTLMLQQLFIKYSDQLIAAMTEEISTGEFTLRVTSNGVTLLMQALIAAINHQLDVGPLANLLITLVESDSEFMAEAFIKPVLLVNEGRITVSPLDRLMFAKRDLVHQEANVKLSGIISVLAASKFAEQMKQTLPDDLNSTFSITDPKKSASKSDFSVDITNETPVGAGVRAGVDDVATKYSDSPYILYSVAKKSPIIVDSASAFEAADVQSSSTNNYFKSWH